MQNVRNNLPQSTREKVCDLLNARLADSIDVYMQTKQAHWNVRGPNFIAIHKMFDDLAAQVEGHIDDLAERVVQLGGLAQGTIQTVAAKTSLPAYPTNTVEWRKHVEALANAYAAVGQKVRAAIDATAEWGDADTADLFTGVSRDVDKALWFIESHLTGGN